MHVKRDVAMHQADNSWYNKYTAYTPYAGYGAYPASTAAEGAMMPDAYMDKRGQMTTKTMTTNTDAISPPNMKRHMPMPLPPLNPHAMPPSTKHTRSRPSSGEMQNSPPSLLDATLPNNWYGTYG